MAPATNVSERTARLDELLRQEISAIIAREVQDPGVGFVTVTRVEVTPDLSHARVWVSMIGQPEERRRTYAALGRALPFVRRELGALRLRRIPELHLRVDDSVERGTRVLQLLNELEAGRGPLEETAGETLPTPGPVAPPEEGRPAQSPGMRRPAGGSRRSAGTRHGPADRTRHGTRSPGGGPQPGRGGTRPRRADQGGRG